MDGQNRDQAMSISKQKPATTYVTLRQLGRKGSKTFTFYNATREQIEKLLKQLPGDRSSERRHAAAVA
jgi:hypothetical protein